MSNQTKGELKFYTLTNQQQASQNNLGVEGKLMWSLRVISILGFVATIAINKFAGRNQGRLSNKYGLYVTPPGYFFAIWGVIYLSLAVVLIVNLFKNRWNKKVHIAYGFSNLFNALWIIVFGTGSHAGVFVSGFIIIFMVVSIFKTWAFLFEISPEEKSTWNYVETNIFAFYLGWVIAATNINWGIIFVHLLGGSKETQLQLFWIFAPLCAIGVFSFNCLKYGKNGGISSFCLWISVSWALSGAAISSHNCLNGLQTRC